MMLIQSKLKQSSIHGLGVFADENIKKGTIIWRFTPGFDLKFTKEQILSFPDKLQIYLYTYSWLSKKSALYCFASDNGKHFNHSDKPNTRSCYKDDEEEAIVIALRDIKKGEELFDDYNSFEDSYTKDDVLDEIAAKFHLEDELDPRFK